MLIKIMDPPLRALGTIIYAPCAVAFKAVAVGLLAIAAITTVITIIVALIVALAPAILYSIPYLFQKVGGWVNNLFRVFMLAGMVVFSVLHCTIWSNNVVLGDYLCFSLIALFSIWLLASFALQLVPQLVPQLVLQLLPQLVPQLVPDPEVVVSDEHKMFMGKLARVLVGAYALEALQLSKVESKPKVEVEGESKGESEIEVESELQIALRKYQTNVSKKVKIALEALQLSKVEGEPKAEGESKLQADLADLIEYQKNVSKKIKIALRILKLKGTVESKVEVESEPKAEDGSGLTLGNLKELVGEEEDRERLIDALSGALADLTGLPKDKFLSLKVGADEIDYQNIIVGNHFDLISSYRSETKRPGVGKCMEIPSESIQQSVAYAVSSDNLRKILDDINLVVKWVSGTADDSERKLLEGEDGALSFVCSTGLIGVKLNQLMANESVKPVKKEIDKFIESEKQRMQRKKPTILNKIEVIFKYFCLSVCSVCLLPLAAILFAMVLVALIILLGLFLGGLTMLGVSYCVLSSKPKYILADPGMWRIFFRLGLWFYFMFFAGSVCMPLPIIVGGVKGAEVGLLQENILQIIVAACAFFFLSRFMSGQADNPEFHKKVRVASLLAFIPPLVASNILYVYSSSLEVGVNFFFGFVSVLLPILLWHLYCSKELGLLPVSSRAAKGEPFDYLRACPRINDLFSRIEPARDEQAWRANYGQ